MNKTQTILVERLNGVHGTGSYKTGWTLTAGVLALQKLNEGEQAHKLAERYPDQYETKQISFRMVTLKRIK